MLIEVNIYHTNGELDRKISAPDVDTAIAMLGSYERHLKESGCCDAILFDDGRCSDCLEMALAV